MPKSKRIIIDECDMDRSPKLPAVTPPQLIFPAPDPLERACPDEDLYAGTRPEMFDALIDACEYMLEILEDAKESNNAPLLAKRKAQSKQPPCTCHLGRCVCHASFNLKRSR